MLKQFMFELDTPGRGLIDVTQKVEAFVKDANIKIGLCHVFLHHTSASLVISENADHLVQVDLEAFMTHLVPDGNPLFQHIAEGPDDMPSHVRAILTQTEVTVPVTDGKLGLGRWQGIYLWEHRTKTHHRRITVTVHGE